MKLKSWIIVLAVAAALGRAQENPKPVIPPTQKDGYTLEWTAANWSSSVKLPGGQSHWQASLSGRLVAPPEKNVVAYTVEMTEVTDAEGRSLMPSPYLKRWGGDRQAARNTQVYRVLGRKIQQGEIGGINISLGGSQKASGKIASAKGTLYILEVSETRQLDLPLGVEGQKNWTDFSEGIKFRVEKVEQRANQHMVQVEHTLEDNSILGEDLTRAPYVFSAVPLDAEGREIPVQLTGFQPRGQGQFIVNVFSQAGEALKPAKLRLFIAASVTERKIDFDLKDLDLGVGGKAEEKKKP